MLRDYQQRAIDQLYDWFRNNDGNPCLVLPTGAGKSHVNAALCKDALQSWPETRVLMLTHVKELIEQNAEKMLQHWPNAPLGIYSASIGRRDIGEPITFAGIMSVRNRVRAIGHIDLVIVDECFVPGTKIATPSGLVDIEKIKCGDEVFNLAGVGVIQAISRKLADATYLVELDDGRSIECTGNHPFLTEEGWRSARDLDEGAYLVGLESMSGLWRDVLSLEESGRSGKRSDGDAGKGMGKAIVLLREVCKEIVSDGSQCSGAPKNKGSAEGDTAQTYSAWRERALTAFAAIGSSACPWGGVGSGVCDQNRSGSPEWRISKCVQGGYSKSIPDDCDRAGWRIAQGAGETRTRPQEGSMLGGPRVVSVSCVERESPTPVFNLQVSGHPSYFAEGVAVHNCHLINHNETGSYREFIDALRKINPHLRVIGLTATPYRLGHGYITDKPALFDALIEPVTIEELVLAGHLSPLRSKVTKTRLDTTGVKTRGGEFIESELQAAVDVKLTNEAVVDEVIARAEGRKAWLFFCSGVDHAQHVADALNERGVPTACVHGKTPKGEREVILRAYKAGQLRALTNANVLTTGFDYPDIDLIAMVRPTKSAGLYMQMAGRGMRLKSHTDHCLVLDFAGVVEMHGPVTAVTPPRRKGEGGGEAPMKVCENCSELCHISARVCPTCKTPFPEPEKEGFKLHNIDIMGIEGQELDVSEWKWRKHVSRASGKDMLAVTYYGGLSDPPVTEYLTVTHEGFAGQRAISQLMRMARDAGVDTSQFAETLEEVAETMNNGKPPKLVEFRKDGKFYRVLRREWNHAEAS